MSKNTKTELFTLRYATTTEWISTVLANFDNFLNDHAQAEKKASGMAMSMLSHYPDRHELVKAMIDLSIEELSHFREVVRIMQARNLTLKPDEKDPYINGFRQHIRSGSEAYMLDRLLTAGIIEARGCERFSLVGEHHSDPAMSQFYRSIAASEARHHLLFIDLAQCYFDTPIVEQRLDELLDIEAQLTRQLPIRAVLH